MSKMTVYADTFGEFLTVEVDVERTFGGAFTAGEATVFLGDLHDVTDFCDRNGQPIFSDKWIDKYKTIACEMAEKQVPRLVANDD